VTRAEEARFWSRVDVGGADACWPWLGGSTDEGYGTVTVDGRTKLAHRVAYELTHGAIARGLVLLHACDARACCNPAHLEPGTHRDNARDRADKHRGHGQTPRPVGRRHW
jgi:hypothetical protein